MKQRTATIPAGSAPAAPKQARELILYVEDDATNRQVTHLWLSADYELLLATSDVEACAQVRQHHSRISCILMDIQLQGSILNGIELTRLLRGRAVNGKLPAYAQNLPVIETPIFFLTAYGDSFSDQALEEAGGNRIMGKPINFSSLNLALAQTSLSKARGRFSRA